MRVLAALAVMIAMTGCATTRKTGDGRIIDDDVERVRALVESLAVCTGEEISAAKPVDSIEPVAGQHGVFRGRLGIGKIICTLMACSDRACCNRCGGTLAIAREGLPRPLPFKDPQKAERYSIGATDCSIEEMRKLADDTEVVVRGRFEEDGPDLAIPVEQLCRIASRP